MFAKWTCSQVRGDCAPSTFMIGLLVTAKFWFYISSLPLLYACQWPDASFWAHINPSHSPCMFPSNCFFCSSCSRFPLPTLQIPFVMLFAFAADIHSESIGRKVKGTLRERAKREKCCARPSCIQRILLIFAHGQNFIQFACFHLCRFLEFRCSDIFEPFATSFVFQLCDLLFLISSISQTACVINLLQNWTNA